MAIIRDDLRKTRDTQVMASDRIKKFIRDKDIAGKDFKPTPMMELFCHVAVNKETIDIEAIEKEIGLNPNTYYEWKKIPGFGAWMNAYVFKLIVDDAWMLNVVGKNKAHKDVRYYDIMQRVTGNLLNQKTTSNTANIQVNFQNVSKSQTEEYEI